MKKLPVVSLRAQGSRTGAHLLRIPFKRYLINIDFDIPFLAPI